MSSTRKVQATSPSGDVATRGSKSKVYTHALAIFRPAQEGYTIPAGTYTHPAKRIKGFNRRAYDSTISQDLVVEAQKESYSIVSFHTSELAARKAGQTYINQSHTRAVESRETYGDLGQRTTVTQFRPVEVEVLDEGFNA